MTNYNNAEALESEGIPALDDAINDDEGIPPPSDHREQPAPRVGRLVAPDEGGLDDAEAAEVAVETGDDLALSAEEAAIHIVEE